MSLAGSGWPKRNAVLSLLDPFAPRQLQHQRLIEGRLRGEVERVEALDLRKPCEAYAALECCAVRDRSAPARTVEADSVGSRRDPAPTPSPLSHTRARRWEA